MPFVARLDYLGLLGVWIDDRPRVRDWWARARSGRASGAGCTTCISEAEFADMRTHGPKIRDDVARLRAGLARRLTASRGSSMTTGPCPVL